MVTEKEVKLELEDLFGLKELVETYEEIAISRMRRIRSSVLATRDFSIGIAQVFAEVSNSYHEEIERLRAKLKKSKQKEETKVLLPNNGKTVAVFLSANTGLYGDIIQRTFQVFIDHLKKNPQEDAVIIGRLGMKYMEESAFKHPVTQYDLSDGTFDRGQVHAIMEKLIQYKKILLFYGLFQSVVTQSPNMLDLYGVEVPAGGQTVAKAKYLFEPDLETILEFFEKEILASIFEQTVSESNLAKYASRMVSLDSATDNITGRIKDVEYKGYVAKHRNLNRKQLNGLTGFSLWKIS
jgi:ATP synthase F1 gamma subunit